jgi:hypothetical protein
MPSAPYTPSSPRLRHAARYPTQPTDIGLPAVWGESTDLLVHLMEWVHRRVRKIAPDEQWVRERYMKRSALELLSEGTTLSLGPCPERTLVASTALSLWGVQHQVVFHERQILGTGPPTVHMVIEVDTDSGPYWLSFGAWESKLLAGEYSFREDIERTISLRRIQAPFSEELLRARPDDLLDLVQTREADRQKKTQWYIDKELRHIRPEHLEERIIFSKEASRYVPRQRRLSLSAAGGPAPGGTRWTP